MYILAVKEVTPALDCILQFQFCLLGTVDSHSKSVIKRIHSFLERADIDSLLALNILQHCLEYVVLALKHGLHVDGLDEVVLVLLELGLQLLPAAHHPQFGQQLLGSKAPRRKLL